MLASLRAELLVLRKSRVAWALVLTVPLLTLVTTYLFGFVDYLGLTPAMYAQFGTPAQNLQGLLPSQFNIQAVNELAFAVLALYALACFVLPVVVTRRRDLV